MPTFQRLLAVAALCAAAAPAMAAGSFPWLNPAIARKVRTRKGMREREGDSALVFVAPLIGWSVCGPLRFALDELRGLT